MGVAGGGGVRVGLARVGSMVGAAGWLVTQAARSGTAMVKTIQCLFTAKWNPDLRDRSAANYPALIRGVVKPNAANHPTPGHRTIECLQLLCRMRAAAWRAISTAKFVPRSHGYTWLILANHKPGTGVCRSGIDCEWLMGGIG